MRAVNLLPRQSVQQKREQPNTVVLVAAIGGAAVLLALVGGFLLANRSANRERQHRAGRARNDAGSSRLGEDECLPLGRAHPA
jgi:hypothetical protein